MCESEIIVLQQLLWIVKAGLTKIQRTRDTFRGRNFIASAATATEHLGIEHNIYCDDQGEPM